MLKVTQQDKDLGTEPSSMPYTLEVWCPNLLCLLTIHEICPRPPTCLHYNTIGSAEELGLTVKKGMPLPPHHHSMGSGPSQLMYHPNVLPCMPRALSPVWKLLHQTVLLKQDMSNIWYLSLQQRVLNLCSQAKAEGDRMYMKSIVHIKTRVLLPMTCSGFFCNKLKYSCHDRH